MRSVGDCRMDMRSASQRRFSRVLKDDFWVAHRSLVVRAWLTRIIFVSCRALRSLKRIADSQTKNHACCCDIDQCDESEASCERVRSIVEDANHINATSTT